MSTQTQQKKPLSKWQRQKAARKQRTKITILSNNTILTPDIFVQILPYLNNQDCRMLRGICKQLLTFIDVYNPFFNRISLFKEHNYTFIDHVFKKEYLYYFRINDDWDTPESEIYNYTSFQSVNENFTIETYVNTRDIVTYYRNSEKFVKYFIILKGNKDLKIPESTPPHEMRYDIDQIVYSGLAKINKNQENLINLIDKQYSCAKKETIDMFVNNIRFNTYNFDFTKKTRIHKKWSDYNFDYIKQPVVNDTYLHCGETLNTLELIKLL